MGFSGTGRDQKKGDERYEGSSKRDNTMGKERKHGTVMDFSEIIRCIKRPNVMFQHVYDVRLWKNKVGYWTRIHHYA
jgi:hypothetical protein